MKKKSFLKAGKNLSMILLITGFFLTGATLIFTTSVSATTAITYNAGTDTILVIDGTNAVPKTWTDIYNADVAGGWGQITRQGTNQFSVSAKIQFGNSTNITWFADTTKQITFNEVGEGRTQPFMHVMNGSHWKSGIIGNVSSKSTGSGCSFISLGTGAVNWFLLGEKTANVSFYASTVQGYTRAIRNYIECQNASFITMQVQVGFRFQDCVNCSWYDITVLSEHDFESGGSTMTVFAGRTYGVLDNILCLNVYDLVYPEGSYPLTIRDLYGVNLYDVLWMPSTRTADVYLVDFDVPESAWTFYFEGSNMFQSDYRVYRQSSFNISVTDALGNPLEDANVSLYDSEDDLLFWYNTTSGGWLPETQDVTYGFYDKTGIDTIRLRSPCLLMINKTGYLNYSALIDVSHRIDLMQVVLFTYDDYFAGGLDLSKWSYRRNITIDHTLVESNLTDFTVLVNLSNDANLSAHADSTGDDIIFTDGTTVYDFEFEYWDNSTGTLVAWVQLPFVSSTVDTVFYMYYGYNEEPMIASQQNPEDTWDLDYTKVFHLTELNDSTSNGYDMTNHGATQVSGIVNNASFFDGINDYMANHAVHPKTANFTLECFVSLNAHDFLQAPYAGVVFQSDGNNAFGLSSNYADNGMMSGRVSSGSASQTVSFETVDEVNYPSGFHYCVYRGDSSDLYYQRDMSFSTSQTQTVQNTGSPLCDFSIGRWGDYTASASYFNGTVDEVRVSDVYRNNSWVNATYNSIENAGLFVSIDVESSVAGASAGIVVNTDASNVTCSNTTWWNGTAWIVNITAESRLNISTNLVNATETHNCVWNTPFWDIVFNATGNTTPVTLYQNPLYASGTHTKTLRGVGGWDVYANYSSAIGTSENIVNASGTHEYVWNGSTNKWWVWANYTGNNTGGSTNSTNLTLFENIVNASGTHQSLYNPITGWSVWANYTGNLTPIHSFENLINASGTHTIVQNGTGYWDWANFTGNLTPLTRYENIVNATGYNNYTLNSTGYHVWSNYTGYPVVVNMTLMNATGNYTVVPTVVPVIIGVWQEDADEFNNNAGANAIDGDWDTFGTLLDDAISYPKYIKPIGATGCTWHVKVADGNYSYPVSESDFNHFDDYVQFYIYYSFASGLEMYYYDTYTLYYRNGATDGTLYEDSVTWNFSVPGIGYYAVNFTAESRLNISTNLVNATETHNCVWNTPFWDIVFNATGNTTPVTLYQNPLYASGTHTKTLRGVGGWDVYANYSSAIGTSENIVNASGTHEYVWNGSTNKWWVWANYTGTGGGAPTPISLFQSFVNATGTHQFVLTGAGYQVWANATGNVSSAVNITSYIPIDGNGVYKMPLLIGMLVALPMVLMTKRKRRRRMQ